MTANTEGTEYIVLGSADLIVDEGIAVGDPLDFVDFRRREARRAVSLRHVEG